MNKHILDPAVQEYIGSNLNADVHKIAMAKSPFPEITGTELSSQIAAKKKCIKKLPLWFSTAGIYYPPLLSVEQCSSELTASYKAKLSAGGKLIDLTGGYGVDSYYFSKSNSAVVHVELNPELSAIAQYNSALLNQSHSTFICGDGIDLLKDDSEEYGTIYIDPARRSESGKVFMLKDCSPNVVENLDLLLSRSPLILIKTAPLLDLTAGLKELKNVAEIHVVSVKNECKELIWVVKRDYTADVKIFCTTLNDAEKQFSFMKNEETQTVTFGSPVSGQYLYEPDVALLKGGAFNLIAARFKLQKLHAQTQLYFSNHADHDFPGRIFKIDEVMPAGKIKKEKNLIGNVIVRNFPDKAASITEKYQIKADDKHFLIFTQSAGKGKIVIKASIIQHY